MDLANIPQKFGVMRSAKHFFKYIFQFARKRQQEKKSTGTKKSRVSSKSMVNQISGNQELFLRLNQLTQNKNSIVYLSRTSWLLLNKEIAYCVITKESYVKALKCWQVGLWILIKYYNIYRNINRKW